MNIDMSTTESLENVKTAFACESQARNRYTYFARQARLEGDEVTASLFEEMADNEKEHAKVWYKVLNNGLGNTLENLEDAAAREASEWEYMYPAFAEKARAEGLELLAIMFDNIAAIEKNHQMMFKERIQQLKAGRQMTVGDRQKVVFICNKCGFMADQQLKVCPVCEERETFEERKFK